MEENVYEGILSDGSVNLQIQMMLLTDWGGRMTLQWFWLETEDHEIKMCRVVQVVSRDEKRYAGIKEKQLICRIRMGKTGDVHPSEPALVLRGSYDSVVAEVLRWGYESARKNTLIFNARSETVWEKPMFRYDYETHRCLIPANKFYEWKDSREKKKEKYEFFAPGEILYFAGIYHKDPEGDRFTILTREAQGCMSGIHSRMPLILHREDLV